MQPHPTPHRETADDRLDRQADYCRGLAEFNMAAARIAHAALEREATGRDTSRPTLDLARATRCVIAAVKAENALFGKQAARPVLHHAPAQFAPAPAPAPERLPPILPIFDDAIPDFGDTLVDDPVIADEPPTRGQLVALAGWIAHAHPVDPRRIDLTHVGPGALRFRPYIRDD